MTPSLRSSPWTRLKMTLLAALLLSSMLPVHRASPVRVLQPTPRELIGGIGDPSVVQVTTGFDSVVAFGDEEKTEGQHDSNVPQRPRYSQLDARGNRMSRVFNSGQRGEGSDSNQSKPQFIGKTFVESEEIVVGFLYVDLEPLERSGTIDLDLSHISDLPNRVGYLNLLMRRPRLEQPSESPKYAIVGLTFVLCSDRTHLINFVVLQCIVYAPVKKINALQYPNMIRSTPAVLRPDTPLDPDTIAYIPFSASNTAMVIPYSFVRTWGMIVKCYHPVQRLAEIEDLPTKSSLDVKEWRSKIKDWPKKEKLAP
ncbi:hypothetical protein EV360DRAFT_67166 [Lentinula raphanica]|nr:hypothetical protein EV360DRAFT_67166 [Lentinula raphanica]